MPGIVTEGLTLLDVLGNVVTVNVHAIVNDRHTDLLVLGQPHLFAVPVGFQEVVVEPFPEELPEAFCALEPAVPVREGVCVRCVSRGFLS